MATKVMLATALAQRAASSAAVEQQRTSSGESKTKRRRTSVYDSDGNEVFITLMCLKCRRVRPLSQFGLRRMPDGAIRNQPWCRPCRAGASPPRTKRAEHGGRDPSVSGESSMAEGSGADPIVDSGKLAAQVVAALTGGRR
jgi:hypothetical protein